MFYIYTELIPLIIAIIIWFLIRPKGFKKYVDFILLLIVVLFIYAFILYILEINSYISEGWMTSATLIFFLIPSLFLTLVIKIIIFFKRSKK